MPIFELGCAIPVKSHVSKFGLDWLKSEGYMWPAMLIFELDRAISVKSRVKICFRLVESFKSYRGNWRYFSFHWGVTWPAIPILELFLAIPVKSHVWKFGSDWLSLSRVIVSTNIPKKKKKKQSGGLHLTCDTHFWTRLTFSSQKSCVKIWFGLVEIRGMLISRGVGGRSPLLEGVTCDLRCPFSYIAELFQSKVMCENLVRSGWAFQELSW